MSTYGRTASTDTCFLLHSSFQTMVLKNAKERLMAVERQMSMSQ